MHKKLTPFLFLSLALAISTSASPVTHAQLAVGALVDTSGQLGYGNRDNVSSPDREVTTTGIENRNATTNEEGDFGSQIRVIAEAQKNSEASTTEAIRKISSRSSLKTLFIGSDYKNLGILRSEMVITQNHLEQLNAILARTTDVTDRAALTTQISALVLDQANIQSFVTAHEKSFSFFGWFVKLL